MNIKDYINGLQHIGLPTGNVENTISFYNLFGFETIYEKENNPKDHVVFLKRGSCVIEGYYSDPIAGKAGAVDHIALDVTDVESVYNFAIENGYQAIEGEICDLDFFEKGVRYFTILGPNNEKLEFNQKL